MHYIFGDYETYSEVNIKDHGGHNYVSHPSFRPLILTYAIDNGPIMEWIFPRDDPYRLPDPVKEAFLFSDYTFVHHGPFDRLVTDIILTRQGLRPFPIRRSIDTSILAREAGMPAPLNGVANALKLETRKNPIGKKAIQAFCCPPRVYPEDDPELWEQFLDYARDDTVICRQVFQRLPALLPSERKLFEVDQRINDRGIRLDVPAIQALRKITYMVNKDLDAQMHNLTGGQVEGVTKVSQLAEYLGMPSVAEKPLEDALVVLEGEKLEAARLRLAGAKSSTRKLPAMEASANRMDQRSRGVLQMAGTRTLRWAGRDWQPQNLPRESFTTHEAEELIRRALDPNTTYKQFRKWYPNPLHAVSMCMRAMVVPAPGKIFLIADYSQIEARLVAWYAGEWKALAVYDAGGDIYKEMASAVYSVPVEKVSKAQRFIGKTLVLGSGYGLGWRGLQRNLAKNNEVVSDEDAQHYTGTFRETWDSIPQFWWALKEALHTVYDNGGVVRHERIGRDGKLEYTGLKLGRQKDSIYIEIATGLRCWFHGVRKCREPTPWDENQEHTVIKARNYNFDGGYSEYTITHMIMSENVCSMTAREFMAGAMMELESKKLPPVMTVHDEIVLELPMEQATADTMKKVTRIMCERPRWGRDIPIAVEAHYDRRYGK